MLNTRSRNLLNNSPVLAEFSANEALKLGLKENCSESIVTSWIILGEIACLKGNTNKALDFYSKSIVLARQTANQQGLCEAIIETGNIFYIRGEYDRALLLFTQADTLAFKNNYHRLEINALNFIGKYYRTKGDFEKSFLYFNRALIIGRRLKDDEQIATTLNHIGKYYISDGKIDLALHCYLEAYQACDRFENQVIYAEVCNHLGGLYLQIDQYEKSLTFHRKALACRNGINTPEGIAKSYNNIGKAYLELKNLDSAIYYFDQSLRICKHIGYKKGTVKSLTNLGLTYTRLLKPNAAKAYLHEAYQIATEAGYDVGIAESGLALGNYFLSIAQFGRAIPFYQLSLSKIKESNFDEIKRDNYLGLFICFNSIKDFHKALEYHILYAFAEKKLLNVENNRQIALVHISFDSERKEKDNQVLRKENQLKEMDIKRKNAMIWFVLIVLCFALILCFQIYGRLVNKRLANLKLEKLNLQISRQNSKLEILNSELEKVNQEKDKIFSIIAHELRNPLYWFQNLVEVLSKKHQTMSPEKINKTLAALDESAKNAFHLMDNLLHWSRSKLKRITPRKLNYLLHDMVMETIRMYETILHHKEIILEIDISKFTLVLVDVDLFNCIIRNLLSNAIKYTPVNGTICITAEDKETYMQIMVSDSGIGVPGDMIERLFNSNDHVSIPGLMQEKGSGFGLKLCKEFVELNDGNIWLESSKNEGTRFYFTIPKFNEKVPPKGQTN